MIKDPNKLCSICRRLKSYSYIMDSRDDYIMNVECKEFPRSGTFRAKDKDDSCIGFINVNLIPVPYPPIQFITEDDIKL